MQDNGWVYFIVSSEQDAVKIGFAEQNVSSRLAMLQTGNPSQLHLYDCFRGSRRLEKALHRRFARYKIKREWFRFHWRIEIFFEELEDLRRARVTEMFQSGELEATTPEEIIEAVEDVVIPEDAILAIDFESEPACPCAVDDECQGTCDDALLDVPPPSSPLPCDTGGEHDPAASRTRTGGEMELKRRRNWHLITHGHAGKGAYSPTYHSWQAMHSRCRYLDRDVDKKHGARGITVCARWSSFESFLHDMGERPDGMTIDRWPDQNGDYEPGNCRWATPTDQARNRRNARLTFDTAVEIALARLRGVPCKVLAEQYGCSESLPREVVKGRTWRDASLLAHQLFAEERDHA